MSNLIELPKGQRTMDDELMVSYLINDEVFRASMEEDLGHIVRMYADWKKDALIYELLDGSQKESVLSELLKSMRKLNYMKSFEN